VNDVGTLATWTNLLSTDFPNSVILWTAGTRQEHRMTALQQFNNDESKWILLATRQSTDEGSNFQRTNHAIIVEPSYRLSVLEQT
jgi:hypothetical protein